MANPQAITPALHSGAEVASGVSAAFDVGTIRAPGAVDLLLDVTVVAGTLPALTVSLETSPSGGADGWRSLGAFDQVIAAATFPRRTFAETERYVRARWVITGTLPSFTFALTGDAHQIYAAPSDLGRYSITTDTLAEIPTHIQADACLRASDDCESAIAAGYDMPITGWPRSLRGWVADVAVYYAMKHRGFNPDGDPMIVKAYNDGQSWFKAVGMGRLRPPGLVDSTPTKYEGGHAIVSGPKRGW